MYRRALLAALPLVILPACKLPPATVLSEAESGVSDASIALDLIKAGADAFFAVKPNATLQGQIDGAISDALVALRAVDAALAGATSLTDGNVQTALASFSTAYQAVMQLVSQIGIQIAPAGVTAATRDHGVLYIPPPRILRSLR